MSGDAGFRLSPQQRRLWFLALGHPAFRCAQCAVLVRGRVRRDALARAVRDTVERHGILRTRFRRGPGLRLPLQVVVEDASFGWRELDLDGLDPAREKIAVREALRTEAARELDLERGPT